MYLRLLNLLVLLMILPLDLIYPSLLISLFFLSGASHKTTYRSSGTVFSASYQSGSSWIRTWRCVGCGIPGISFL